MDDLATQQALDRATGHLQTLVGVRPDALVADRHPGYRSRRWAHDHAAGRPVSEVQHHHAHVASTMVEHGVAPGTAVIGIAFDGTGYGDDGAVWGGEVLVADYATYERVAHLRYVAAPRRRRRGGQRRAGWRCPTSRPPGSSGTRGSRPSRPAARPSCALLRRQLDTGFACAPTSSMGRLFDAVASLTGVRHRVGYEAQAAIELEGAARDGSLATEGEAYRFAGRRPGDRPRAGRGGASCATSSSGTPTPVVARRFHAAVADLVLDRRPRAARAYVAGDGDPLRGRLPQRAAHRAVRRRASTPPASGCCATTASRPATPGSRSASWRSTPTDHRTEHRPTRRRGRRNGRSACV